MLMGHGRGQKLLSGAVALAIRAKPGLFAQGTRAHLDGTLRGANQSLQSVVCSLQSTVDTQKVSERNAVPNSQHRVHSRPSTSIHEPGAQRSRDSPSHARKLLILFGQTLLDPMTQLRFSLARLSGNPVARYDSPFL